MNTKEINRIRKISASFKGVDELVFWSFRYFLGRRTAAGNFFAASLAESLSLLTPSVQSLISKELEEAFLADDAMRSNERCSSKYYPLGDNCDREAWMLVKNSVEELKINKSSQGSEAKSNEKVLFTPGQPVIVNFSEGESEFENYRGSGSFLRYVKRGEGWDRYLNKEPYCLVKIDSKDNGSCFPVRCLLAAKNTRKRK